LTTDNTTSPERQMAAIKKFAVYREHDLVEITEADYDLDVSGAVSPFDRPGLGRWLKPDKIDDWDAICAAKLDRISRSLFDFTALVHWLEAHGKSLIILDPELDLTTKEGRVMANILMTFAEYEREVIGARVKDAYDKLVRDGKYRGGSISFGYRPVKLDKNFGYEIDPVYGPLVTEMAERFLAYESLGSIARWLQEAGVPTPMDVHRKRNGKPLKGSPWAASTVRTILSNPAVLGAVVNKHGETLRDDQGLVIYRADPLITRDQYEKVKLRLSQNTAPVKVNSSPLLQIAFCAACGAPMHSDRTSRVYGGKLYEYEYYWCHYAHSNDGRCSAKRVKAEPLEDAVFGTLLELVGHKELTEESVIPGRDYSEEMARIIEQTQHLQAEIGRARIQRKDFTGLQSRLDTANAELDRLAALEPEPATLIRVPTSQTFSAWWDAHDQTARNAFLRDQRIKIVVSPDPLPEDLVLARPDMIFSVSVIERDGIHAVLYMGNLGDLLNRAGSAPITVRT
jgi:site-specific DNA recombinase